MKQFSQMIRVCLGQVEADGPSQGVADDGRGRQLLSHEIAGDGGQGGCGDQAAAKQVDHPRRSRDRATLLAL
ncbi:hypothetical protein [Phenylobacterium sp.]|uniref:hypothetical protein n=1 Tax=Phenylobacterium sp. TaxID=1871053 RepID=UPI0039833291